MRGAAAPGDVTVTAIADNDFKYPIQPCRPPAPGPGRYCWLAEWARPHRTSRRPCGTRRPEAGSRDSAGTASVDAICG